MFKEFEQTKTDAAAKKRTAASLVGAIGVYAAIGAVVLYAATGTKRKPQEPEVDVVLTSSQPLVVEKAPPPLIVAEPEPPVEEALLPPQVVAEETSAPRPHANNPPPLVPIERRRSGAGGLVVVAVTIAASGEVHVREVRRGEPDLVKAVLSVLPRWRFDPATFEGTPVSVDKILEIPIRIGG